MPADMFIPSDQMTLRDWFAAQALSGIIASYAGTSTHYEIQEDANRAYKYADAMLAARNQLKD